MVDRQATLHSLLGKLSDPDPDIRYMSLNDVYGILSSPNSLFLLNDNATSAKLSDGLLKALEDQHGEVQNQALKCLGPLAGRLPVESLTPLLERIADLTSSSSIDSSVPNTALRVIVSSLPSPRTGSVTSAEATNTYSAISKVLLPRLTGEDQSRASRRGSVTRGMLEKDANKGYSSDAIDIVIELVNCFGSLLKEVEIASLQKSIMAIIENDTAGTVVTKRALTATAALVVYFSDAQLSAFVSELIESFGSAHLTVTRRRHLIATIGSLSRAAPSKFGVYLKTLAPFVLSAVSEQEMDEMAQDDSDGGEQDPQADELRETALITLEGLLSSCTQEMQPYLMDSVNSALRCLKYDPNVAFDEDEEMGGIQDEGSEDGVTEEADEIDDEFEDFEDEGGYSDVDDVSWKVRRCAAKTLHTIISSYGTGRLLEDGTLYQQVAPALISRLAREREESVKLEVVVTFTALVRKTSEGLTVASLNGYRESVGGSKNSRKRRRQDSFAGVIDFEPSMGTSSAIDTPVTSPTPPESGPQAELLRLLPGLIQNMVKSWKSATVALRQAIVVLLKSLALARYGILADYLQKIEDPIADALKASTSSGTAITAGTAVSVATLQIETLTLVGAISETHASDALLPFLIALIPGVIASVGDRNYKVASEALGAIECVIKALTPPRVSGNDTDNVRLQLQKLYEVIVSRITDTSADLEVRQRAIHVFGVLLARTSGDIGRKFVSESHRFQGLDILGNRLKNETTRLATARAIDDISVLASSEQDVNSHWITQVTSELGAQLRKSDRTLRSACLEALRSLAMNPNTRAHYKEETMLELEKSLLPLIAPDDFHLLAPALIILAKIIPSHATRLVTEDLISSLCAIVAVPLIGTVLKALLLLVKVIGEQDAGADLMKRLLRDVGINGDPSVVGRAIGTLLVHGGSNLGVKMEDFLAELETAQDDQRKCLALAILGEVSLRMGASCPIKPHLFISNFDSKSDKVRLAAAVALGNAAASNIKAYMPIILEGLNKPRSSTYLLLHSIKEILHHPEHVRDEIAPFATQLWQILLAASEDEDNRVVGSECIGRLALLDPSSYVPHLHSYLSDQNATIRGTIISAFRYTLSDSSVAYNDVLRPLIIPLLVSMLSDRDLGNHRLALTTLNSAIHNKMDIIHPHLSELLPAVIGDTQIKPELIREVQMGPFKHKVDDGLELRKTAYETLYASLDAALNRINVSELYERILAGLDDEQDIRTLCNLMTAKLIALASEETQRQLDALSERYMAVLNFKPKENAVKQEIEKAQEASLGILKISRELDKAFPGVEVGGEHPKWKSYVDWMRKTFQAQLRNLDAEA
ncbi:Cullin-associated NEDD8-dissociated protein 1, C-terminal part [Talaromyces atroroseus]|uniref:Cullin-associated NEDD8-dissociated protein 1, C-terminal part n=1 Tax=Talaromyces atroroseus TaxID=1441469 RepID=A0A225AJ83_TALAT|nr:Cullin-associated NEDD8-dissociated protein 1, C-terminal part [Talaromyces atroroseus]OKL58304.1 Cullin-associated NEDD8-dissociated protein 1, C-terminal part [Talaromyces atroroseus]